MAGTAYKPGKYREEALIFLKERLGEKQFARIMANSDSRERPYVAARVFLSHEDWDKYTWIEQHGSLKGFLQRGNEP